MSTIARSASGHAIALTIVGVLTLLFGAAYAVVGGYCAVSGAVMVKDLENDPAGGFGFLLQLLAGFVTAVGVVFLLQGVPGVVAGAGLLMRKSWGRVLAFIFAAMTVLWGAIFVAISQQDATMIALGAVQFAYGIAAIAVLILGGAEFSRPRP